MTWLKYLNKTITNYIESSLMHFSVFSLIPISIFIISFIFSLVILYRNEKFKNKFKSQIKHLLNGITIYFGFSISLKIISLLCLEKEYGSFHLKMASGKYFALTLFSFILIILTLVILLLTTFQKNLILILGRIDSIIGIPINVLGGASLFISLFLLPFNLFSFNEIIFGSGGETAIIGLLWGGIYLILFFSILYYFILIKKIERIK